MRNSTVGNHNINFHNRTIREKKVLKWSFFFLQIGQTHDWTQLERLGGSPMAANLVNMTCAAGCGLCSAGAPQNTAGDTPQRTTRLSPGAMPVETFQHPVRGWKTKWGAEGKGLFPHVPADNGADIFWQSLIFGQPNKHLRQEFLSVLMYSSHNILNKEVSWSILAYT